MSARPKGKTSFYESLALSSARRPWTTIGIWVLVIIISVALRATLFEDAISTEFAFTSNPDSKKADELLEERFGLPKGTSEVVIVQSETMTVDAPAYQEFVEGLFGKLEDLGPDVIRQETLINYYQEEVPFLVSDDRQTTIMPFTMAGEFDDATDNISSVIDVVDQAREEPGFRVLISGQATVSKDFEEVAQDGLAKGEAFGIPIALIILILVFGALVAALVPLILAVASIIVAFGAASLLGQAIGLIFFIENMIFMIGLAVGIDYSLFIVDRYREERRGGLEKLEAIGKAGSTATRAVSFSGMAVVTGLIGMLLVPSNVFIAIGLGAIFVVIAAVIASMTFLPAILSLLGDRVNKLAIPMIGATQTKFDATRPGGVWDKISSGVMKQPVISLLLAGGLLIAILIPFFGIKTGTSGVSTMPDGIESKEGFLILDEKFSAGEATPAEIVIDGDIDSPAIQSAIDGLIVALEAETLFAPPRPLEVNEAGDLAVLRVPIDGDPVSVETQEGIKRLRGIYIPGAFDGVPATVVVTGEAAFNLDFFEVADNAAFVVFPFVLGVSLLLLLLVFRSVVVPVKAVILNLLSVGATYGLLVLIFQEGVGNEIFGFQQADTIEAWLPIFLFAVLFGLSMDYHVFLLSRIRERFDQTHNNTESVAFGIRSTGRLITGAALIMVAVFWGFAAGDLVGLQQMGFGLGIAVLLDATIVRMVLVPASMKLLGKWNWYLPTWLEWLPDLRVEVEEVPCRGPGNRVRQLRLCSLS